MICTTWGRGKDKKATSFLNKQSGTQFHHDWKPMQSIIDILHKNFQEDHTNSRRFPGFPEFPGVVDPCQISKIRTCSCSRSSKVIDLGANQKRICTFLLATNSNFGRISYRFRDIDAFTLKIACYPHPSLV